MFRRLTSRCTLKWSGTIACALIAAVFVASRWLRVNLSIVDVRTHGIGFTVAEGVADIYDADLTVEYLPEAQLDIIAGREPTPISRHKLYVSKTPRVAWWPTPFLELDSEILHWGARIPLWIPFMLLAIPTAWLWRLDRRRPRPGCCRTCDYDLTGNVSGRCPECGAVIRPATTADHQKTRF